MKKVLILIITLAITSVAFAGDWQTKRVYRGFAELGGIIGTGDHGENALAISTTHGYQVIPSYLFIGAGVGFNTASVTMPVYVDIRSQLPTGKLSPFIDIRGGYGGKLEWSFNDGGVYINPSVGTTWTISNKIGLDFAVGYTYQKATTLKIESSNINGHFICNHKQRDNIGGVTICIGVTF